MSYKAGDYLPPSPTEIENFRNSVKLRFADCHKIYNACNLLSVELTESVLYDILASKEPMERTKEIAKETHKEQLTATDYASKLFTIDYEVKMKDAFPFRCHVDRATFTDAEKQCIEISLFGRFSYKIDYQKVNELLGRRLTADDVLALDELSTVVEIMNKYAEKGVAVKQIISFDAKRQHYNVVGDCVPGVVAALNKLKQNNNGSNSGRN